MSRFTAGVSVSFLLVYLLWAGWLSQYPIQITSDDALNFSRAIERFSVLEFRPHFPGYPAFVGMSRFVALWSSPDLANVMLSLMAAIALPMLVFGLIVQLSGSWQAACLGGLLVLIQPLMASVALSGLSDSLAMVFLLLALMSGFRQKHALAGLCIGLMLATRPSYFPLALGCMVIPLLNGNKGSKLRAYVQASFNLIIVGLLSLAFIWSKDGSGYFVEGIRFTQGHFSTWGNTAAGDNSGVVQWLDTLTQTYGIVGIGLMMVCIFFGLSELRPSRINRLDIERQGAIALINATYLIWVLVAQNPDNLRHWTPVVVLFAVLLPLQVQAYLYHGQRRKVSSVFSVACLVYFAAVGGMKSNFEHTQSPTQQAITWIKQHPEIKVVGTNYSVNLLREQLNNRAVYDMYYPSSQLALLSRQQAAFRLSGSRLNDQQLITQFPARFSGERQLYLYKASNNTGRK